MNDDVPPEDTTPTVDLTREEAQVQPNLPIVEHAAPPVDKPVVFDAQDLGVYYGSFKAVRPLRIALAVAGSLAVEGPPTEWVADHRRHHAFTDRAGDPHSPWRYGSGVVALTKGLLYAHCGWFLNKEITNKSRFAPDVVADRR